MERIAIIGFGCAGYNGARALRACGFPGEIHVFEGTLNPPANPMLTTYYVSGRLEEKDAYPFGRLESICEELKLSFHSGKTVRKVWPDIRITLEDETEELFDKILISTGARALLPPLRGLPSSRVFVMRTMEDACRMKEVLEEGNVKKAVVAGASMAGIKVAELLLAHKVDVTLADFASHLFQMAALEPVARELERRAEQKGLKFLWNSAIEEITDRGARFSRGEEIPADLICLCIGTRANVELAANTEAVRDTVEIRGGIVVNSRMETSVPGIYAAGDCCAGLNLQTGEHRIIGLWANAGLQGETAGKNMAGVPAWHTGNVAHNVTHFMDMDFISLGDPRLPGETVTFGRLSDPRYVRAVVKDGRIRCLNLIGGREESGMFKSLFMRCFTGAPVKLAPFQRAALLDKGYAQEFLQLLEGGLE